MKVKKIELIGFKSFAEKTELYLGDGLTCIVGPNGCGKSNISDALHWVFGERSAKLLRGTKMEDVIFSGTDLRNPLGMAEVSLVLDNEDHQLPISYDEVVISRRLYRSGQSEYLLNRTPCRLRDILDLILDTGMGSNSYSMIEQGRVDYVINADPQERRFLIEEAAGISKYKVKKEEAIRKLERTEQNLLRIRDIIAEIQRNIQYAERQARRAERYKEQFEQLKKKEIQKALFDLSQLENQMSLGTEKKQQLTEHLEKLTAELQGLLKKQKEEKKILDEIQEAEAAKAARFFEIRSESRAVIQKREFNRERLETCRRRQAEINKEIEILNTSLTELGKEIVQKTAEHKKLQEEWGGVEEAFRKEKSRLEATESEWRAKKSSFEELKRSIFQTASNLAELRNEFQRLENKLETGIQGQIRRKEVQARLSSEKQSLKEKCSLFDEGETKRAQELACIEERIANLTDHLTRTRASVESLEKSIENKRLRFQELASRLRLLEELQESADESEKRLLASLSPDKLRGGLVRSLRDVLQVKSGFESAVEAVLGSFAQCLVAEDVEVAKGLMQEMTKVHMGPCGIFVQSLVRPNGKHPKKSPPPHPKIRQSICEVVQIQKGMEGLFESLFENVFVVDEFSHDHLEELLSVAQEVKLVTKKGILLGPEARIFFRNGRISQESGSFKRHSEIQELKSRAESLLAELQSAEADKVKLKEKEAHLLRERDVVEEARRKILIQREIARSASRGFQERFEKIEEELKLLQFETSEFDHESSQIKTRLEELKEEIGRMEAEEKKLLEQQVEFEWSMDQIQREREEQIQTLSRLKTLLENYEEKLCNVATNEKLVRTHWEKESGRLERLNQEAEELIRQVEEISKAEGVLAKQETHLEEVKAKSEEILNQIRGRKAFQDESLKKISMQLAEVEERTKAVQKELHEEELKLMDSSYRETSILARIREAYHIDLKEFSKEEFSFEDLNLTALDEEIRTLKAKIEAFGPVNLLAVDEYQELKQRYDFMVGQEKDLNDARESLLEAIRKINRTTKTLFHETFAKAQTFFQEYYQVLFGGGKAELILIEDPENEDPGIDIMVRPPGKKLQRITLLSGGEKTLTALALLFALFRIKPSPLCVLDEVDAALDEANVDRFLKVLTTFTQSTQFLVITHNRKTIAASNSLYGVTMEESGVSKLVSVKVVTEERAFTN